MIERILKLKKVIEDRMAIEAREEELKKPVLTDLELVPTLYGWFKEILSERACPPLIESVTQRKKFLFVVLMLYCPGSLCGERIMPGLRDRLANTLEIAKTAISNNCSDMIFFYERYGDYRVDVGKIYGEILGKLSENGESCDNLAKVTY